MVSGNWEAPPGRVPGSLLPAELEQAFQFPQAMGTAHAVAGNMRHPEVGLSAIMHDNAHGLEHHVSTTPADPEVHQQTFTRNMQPVELASGPETGPIHVDGPGTDHGLPDMLPRSAEPAGQ